MKEGTDKRNVVVGESSSKDILGVLQRTDVQQALVQKTTTNEAQPPLGRFVRLRIDHAVDHSIAAFLAQLFEVLLHLV